MPVSPIGVFQPRGQCIILVLAALKDRGVSLSRREAVDHIGNQRWFAMQDEDWKPYPSQKQSGEARWKTLIAWARKDAVLRNFVNDFERDSWSLSRDGRQLWAQIADRFKNRDLDVSRGYLWAPGFKQWLYPDYKWCVADIQRPHSLYRDCFTKLLHDIAAL